METNETLKTALWLQAEMELQHIMERVQALAEGDLKGLEEQVDGESAQQSAEEQRPAAHRQGGCGHEQRFVGERPKQVLTRLGESDDVSSILSMSDQGSREDYLHTWGSAR
jgi:hypothetical protein